MSKAQAATERRVPAGWNHSRLGDVCSWLSGGTPSTSIVDYWNGDIPWVSPKDLKQLVVSDSIDHVTAAGIASLDSHAHFST
jgi:type I restriction enzyme S subunit